jgi:DNA-binding SARP family transcriptional activator
VLASTCPSRERRHREAPPAALALPDEGRTVISEHARLCVLGGFQLVVASRSVVLPTQAQRLLVLLALGRVGQSRSMLAGTLWGSVSEQRAHANLRNAVWRVRMISELLLDCTHDSLTLGPQVTLDLQEARARAHHLLHDAAALAGQPLPDRAEPRRAGLVIDSPDSTATLEEDVLPGWDEDWLVIERERQRQLRMHALEALSQSLSRRGRYAEAITTALAAIRAEPLRESAQRTLIVAYLGEGNVSEAVRQLDSYRRMLVVELGIAPSRALRALVADACHAPA